MPTRPCDSICWTANIALLIIANPLFQDRSSVGRSFSVAYSMPDRASTTDCVGTGRLAQVVVITGKRGVVNGRSLTTGKEQILLIFGPLTGKLPGWAVGPDCRWGQATARRLGGPGWALWATRLVGSPAACGGGQRASRP